MREGLSPLVNQAIAITAKIQSDMELESEFFDIWQSFTFGQKEMIYEYAKKIKQESELTPTISRLLQAGTSFEEAKQLEKQLKENPENFNWSAHSTDMQDVLFKCLLQIERENRK